MFRLARQRESADALPIYRTAEAVQHAAKQRIGDADAVRQIERRHARALGDAVQRAERRQQCMLRIEAHHFRHHAVAVAFDAAEIADARARQAALQQNAADAGDAAADADRVGLAQALLLLAEPAVEIRAHHHFTVIGSRPLNSTRSSVIATSRRSPI